MANAMGVSWNEFWSMNPHIINLLVKGQEEKNKRRMQEQDRLNWYLGQYFASALDCTVCNSEIWRKRGSNPHSYIEKPILQESDKKNEPMTEDGIQKRRELFIASMKAMQANFESNRKAETQNEQKVRNELRKSKM